MSSQEDEEFSVLRTEEANQMKKLANILYSKQIQNLTKVLNQLYYWNCHKTFVQYCRKQSYVTILFQHKLFKWFSLHVRFKIKLNLVTTAPLVHKTTIKVTKDDQLYINCKYSSYRSGFWIGKQISEWFIPTYVDI